MTQERQQQLFSEPEPEPRKPAWELADLADRQLAEVVFNLPLNRVFHYLVPDHLRGEVKPGSRLKLPFGRGNQLQTGYCVGVLTGGELPAETNVAKLKEVFEVVDASALVTPNMLALTKWIAEYYLCGWGQVLESIIPAGVRNQAGTRMASLYRVPKDISTLREGVELPEKQLAVLEAACAATDSLPAETLARMARCGLGPVMALKKRGLLEIERRRIDSGTLEAEPSKQQQDLTLNQDQEEALRAIHSAIRSQETRTLLLHGVTGSGKTEVYIQAIREVVEYGRQAIVLVPEISLTPQTIRRFRARFQSVAVLHSHLSDAERHRHWQRIASGEVQVIVGARSAIFAPAPHLGLIIIDEEHETSFKQDSTPRYHAREVARRRAELEKIPLILGSATPSLESWERTVRREWDLVRMPNRVENLPMPPVVVVDIRNDQECQSGASIGRALRTAMQNTLQSNGQVILFLNLRGFSPVLWCRACGGGIKCPNCDVTLTWHKDDGMAVCHECDFRMKPPSNCPTCGHAGIKYLGAGTQRLEQEVRTKFPGVTCMRMDSDAMRKPGSHHDALEKFRKGEVRILLGTQMIAKGLDFPNVTLVGVISADTALHQPDLRATERTFHLIAQVAGRTGRSKKGGRVLVQSTSPEEESIQLAAKHDFESFARGELEHRAESGAPPYSKLARIILRSTEEPAVREYALRLGEILRQKGEGLEAVILGPAPAPLAKSNGFYRYHLQVTAPSVDSIHRLWLESIEEFPKSNEVEYTIDVEPMNMR